MTWAQRAYATVPAEADLAADRDFAALSAPQLRNWRAGSLLHLFPKDSSSRAIARTGEYEPETMSLLERLLRAGDTFIDVGANMGMFTVVGARLVGDAGCVIAFEPSKRERDRLRLNISANKAQNILVRRCALGRKTGLQRLRIARDENAGLNTLGRAVPYDCPTQRSDLTLIRTLDSFRLARVDLIKVDIEGAEADFLHGAQRTLLSLRPKMILEIGHDVMRAYGSTSFAAIERAMGAVGYRMHEITPAGDVGAPVAEPGADRNIIALPLAAAS